MLKSCKIATSLEGARDSLSVPIRLLVAVLTEPLNTTHSRLPFTQHTPKQVIQPTEVHFSLLPLHGPYLRHSSPMLTYGI
jgi:hypothetical protein